ncbi:hypothetical protein JW979_10080, partial [bacterium]|nr:hypothetical protein [candidate division CSSED10-310 bacterium]
VKAGDAGLGFQVIVREIRELTKSSNKEIVNIANTLGSIVGHAEHTSNLSKNCVEMIGDVRKLSLAIMDIVSSQNKIITKIVEESNDLMHQSDSYEIPRFIPGMIPV